MRWCQKTHCPRCVDRFDISTLVGAVKRLKRQGRLNPPFEILAEYHNLMAVRNMASKVDYTG